LNLVSGHDKVVHEWASQQFGRKLAPCYSAFGLIDKEGPLLGAVIFQDYNGSNIEVSYWGHGFTLGVIKQLMSYCFEHLKVERVTARTPRDNKALLRQMPKIGFKYEGCLRRYYGPHKRHDALIFGMLKSDVERFLRRT